MSSQSQERRESQCGVISRQSVKAAQQECGGAGRQRAGQLNWKRVWLPPIACWDTLPPPLQTSAKRDGSSVRFKVEVKDGQFVLGGRVTVGDVSEPAGSNVFPSTTAAGQMSFYRCSRRGRCESRIQGFCWCLN